MSRELPASRGDIEWIQCFARLSEQAAQKGARKSQERASNLQSFVKLSVMTLLTSCHLRSEPWRLSGAITNARVIEPFILDLDSILRRVR